MAKRTQKQAKENPLARRTTPYERYFKGVVWRTVDKALADLEQNKDLEITTERDLVIGLLAKRVEEALARQSKRQSPKPRTASSPQSRPAASSPAPVVAKVAAGRG